VPENARITDLRKRLEKDPASRLFAQLAEELRKEGNLEESIRLCRDGLTKHPNYPSARMTLGRALLETGDVSGARSEFEQALKDAPDNILASRSVGECLERLGDLPGAISRYKATLLLAAGDKYLQSRIQEIEARLAAPLPPAAGRMPISPASAAAAPSEEPAPIPLSDVSDESFELERPFEVTRVAGGQEHAVENVSTSPTAAPEARAVAPQVPVVNEPPPIPLAAADESFELYRPTETLAPQANVGPAEAGPGPKVETRLNEAGDFEFEVPARTLPFQPTPRVRLEDEGPAVGVRPAQEPQEIVSSTLAELYFKQGFTEKAIEVYRQLVRREPGNHQAGTRLAELETFERKARAEVIAEPLAAGDPQVRRRRSVQQTIARLEGLLAAVRRG